MALMRILKVQYCFSNSVLNRPYDPEFEICVSYNYRGPCTVRIGYDNIDVEGGNIRMFTDEWEFGGLAIRKFFSLIGFGSM